MKCEHCNNDMVWKGSLQGGRMHCYHCEVTGVFGYDLPLPECQVMRVPKGATVVMVGGGGGGGRPSEAPVSGHGDCEACTLRNDTIEVETIRLPNGRLIYKPIRKEVAVTAYVGCTCRKGKPV